MLETNQIEDKLSKSLNKDIEDSSEHSSISTTNEKVNSGINEINSYNKESSQIIIENNNKRQISNQPQQSESIKTYCRIRPFNGINILFTSIFENNQLLLLNKEAIEKMNLMPSAKQLNSYSFTRVFSESTSQQEIFEITTKQLVVDLIEKRKSGLIFTYGMTNAGKTFTITGTPVNPGILPLTLNYLFTIQNSNTQNSDFTLYCNFVEIYNEEVYDLLSDDPNNQKNKIYKKKINVKENKNNLFYLQDVTNSKLTNAQQFSSVLNQGITKKAQSSTNLNHNSSRSHTIFKLIICPNSYTNFSDPNVTYPSLSIVDLAGSERATRTENTGQKLAEACKINQSLSVLGKCLKAMKHNSIYTKKVLVPFRESKLTKIFCEYFQGNENITMITNINPRKEDFEETIRALDYSCVAKDINPIKSRIIPIKKMTKPINKKDNRANMNTAKKNKENKINKNDFKINVNFEGDINKEKNSKEEESNQNNDMQINEAETKPNDYMISLEEIQDFKKSFDYENEITSNTNEIAKLVFDIKQLKEEVNQLKTGKIETDNSQEINTNEEKEEIPVIDTASNIHDIQLEDDIYNKALEFTFPIKFIPNKINPSIIYPMMPTFNNPFINNFTNPIMSYNTIYPNTNQIMFPYNSIPNQSNSLINYSCYPSFTSNPFANIKNTKNDSSNFDTSLINVEDIQKDPQKFIETLPLINDQDKKKSNGVNLFFINPKFNDFHLGKNDNDNDKQKKIRQKKNLNVNKNKRIRRPIRKQQKRKKAVSKLDTILEIEDDDTKSKNSKLNENNNLSGLQSDLSKIEDYNKNNDCDENKDIKNIISDLQVIDNLNLTAPLFSNANDNINDCTAKSI